MGIDKSERRNLQTNKQKQLKEKKKPYDITYMWTLKYGTDEHVYKRETDSQT